MATFASSRGISLRVKFGARFLRFTHYSVLVFWTGTD
jgi:hypothetical protein